MLTIQVLGPGCENCANVEAVVRRAVGNLALEAEIVKVTDRAKFYQYALLSTPGLVINEKLVCAGRIPEEGEVVNWMVAALEPT